MVTLNNRHDYGFRRLKVVIMNPLSTFVVGLLTATLIVGLLTSTRTVTGDEARAQLLHDRPERVTSPVQFKALSKKVFGRGTTRMSESHDISCRPGDTERRKVFTSQPEFGKSVDEGDLIAAVNERPIIALEGSVPMFRDIKPGSRGVDVLQLQKSLSRIGLFSEIPDGQFGKSTQDAVAKLYDNLGYEAVGPSSEEFTSLREAEEAVARASSALESGQGPDQNESQLPDDGSSKPRPVVPRRTLREQELVRAKDSRDELRASIGITVPFCELVFTPQVPAVLLEKEAAVQEGDNSASGAWASLGSGSVIVEAEILAGQDAHVIVGSRAQLDDSGDGQVMSRGASVTSLGKDNAKPGSNLQAVLTPDEPYSSLDIAKSVKVSILLQSTEQEVLVVPLAALVSSADGTLRVTRVVDNSPSEAQLSDVVVKAGIAADGFVEISVVDGGLSPGDNVLVS